MKIKLVRKETLLEVFQVTERQLYNLEQDGIAVKYKGGYKLVESIKNYCALSKKRSGGAGEKTVSSLEISEILGIAERTTRELAMKGILKKDTEGVYKLKESIQGYLNYKLGDGEESKNEIYLKKKADREIKEIALLEKKGELVRKSDVREFIGTMLITFKNTILAFPDKLASRIEIDNRIRQDIKDGLTEILEELSANEYN